jgi:hypothetical protein
MRTLICRLAILLTFVMVPLAHAQDGGGLSDDQLALLDRVQHAMENYQSYTSLVEMVSGGQGRELIITAGDTRQTFSTVATWERTSQVIREGDEKNVLATVTATVIDAGTNPDGTEGGSRTRVVYVEARRVDGQLYLLAEYGPETTQGPDLPELPEGWFVVAQLGDWEALSDLGLEDLLQSGNPFQNIERVKEAATDVELAAGTLADGTPVDMITVTFDRAGLTALFTEGAADGGPLLLQVLDEGSYATFSIMLDAADQPYEVMSEVVLHTSGLDANTFGMRNQPEGATVEFTNELARHEVYSQINATFEPATVPEELAQ